VLFLSFLSLYHKSQGSPRLTFLAATRTSTTLTELRGGHWEEEKKDVASISGVFKKSIYGLPRTGRTHRSTTTYHDRYGCLPPLRGRSPTAPASHKTRNGGSLEYELEVARSGARENQQHTRLQHRAGLGSTPATDSRSGS